MNKHSNKYAISAKRIHLHQTSTTRYVKGTAIRRGRKRVRERGTQVPRGENE